MRIETALLASLALASLGQDCGSRNANNSNTTNAVRTSSNSNANHSASAQAVNHNDATPKPSPGGTENNAQVNDSPNSKADTPPKNQKKIPAYGELGHDAPPANIPVRKPEPKSSPR
jgi:hypothetical protein